MRTPAQSNPSQALVLRLLGTMRLDRVDQAEEVAALLVTRKGAP